MLMSQLVKQLETLASASISFMQCQILELGYSVAGATCPAESGRCSCRLPGECAT